jgi:putative intracellular protease/amidase
LAIQAAKTGFWLEEFAAPYFVFRDAGVDLTLASPKGGQPPIDPKSDPPENQTPAMAQFKKDERAKKELSQTAGERPKPFGEALGFDSIKSTLIFGEYDAVLVDAMMR